MSAHQVIHSESQVLVLEPLQRLNNQPSRYQEHQRQRYLCRYQPFPENLARRSAARASTLL